jgi:ComF family protein
MFTALIQATASALKVSTCAVCHSHASAWVCEPCIGRFGQARLRCQRCARAMVGSPLAHVNTCGACLREPPAMAQTLAAVDYAYPWDQLLAQLKFDRTHSRLMGSAASANPAMAQSLAAIMLRSDDISQQLSSSDWIIPMPLHLARQGERGFNQSLELARSLIRQHESHAVLKSRLLPKALLRLRDTPPQVGLSGSERRKNLRHAFAVEPAQASLLAGRRISLVDDVTTTGTTLSTAAQALLQAGVSEVTAIVFARTTEG